jgi:asparagine synthase (glutamine-hydrolysing)
MCGIAGFASLDLPETAPSAVARMVQSLERRGPDSEGIHAWPAAILGHRRLSIFDLSDAGRQPMLSADGAVGVVFNGAVYNFLELRAELERDGHRFHSRTDTEILVEGYRAWGIDKLVSRLRGMFAFAVWDDAARRLCLVRDRLGVKPLFYCERPGRIVFASTARALYDAGFAAAIDPAAVLEFLEFGFVTDERSIYSEIHKVKAGHIVEFVEGRITDRPYWTLPHADEHAKISFEDAVAETERLLIEAVRLRLFADVPVGALLSGGIDSSLICWAMSQLNANIRSFTVSTPGDPADETRDAAETARILGIPHAVIELPPGRPPDLDELTASYGEPFACSSALGMLKVCRTIKSMLTVLLTGDGGDDVYLGYSYQQRFLTAQRLAESLPRPAAALWPAIRPLAAALPFLRRPRHLLDYATGGLGAVIRAADGLPWYLARNIPGERLAGHTLAQRRIPPSFDSARHLLQDFLDYDQNTRFVSEFMTKVDGSTMRYAIEARSPLLDQEIWNFAARLPFSLRLHNGELKSVLREIVRRRIGPQVAQRPKRGFTIPVENWLVQHWPDRLRALAAGSMLEREGWIRPGSLQQPVREAIQRGRAPVQLWYLMVLENWLRNPGSPVDRQADIRDFSRVP